MTSGVGMAQGRGVDQDVPVVIERLSKIYGEQRAVDDLSFAIAPGRVTGFLGPNGAGKTTMIRTLLGLTQPTSGDVALLGLPQPAKRAEALAVADPRAIAEYRAGRACHPLQPFVEWSACDATSHRLGAVLIAGCRDAQSARQLGYVPAHGLPAALEMARGRGARRVGYLLAPPYFPLVVGSS